MHGTRLASVACRELPWQHSTRSIFSALSHLPWAMLLDSADATHPDARYDIISAWPLATLTTEGNRSEIRHGQQAVEVSEAAPLTLLRQLLQQYFPDRKSSPLPFSGGAIGSLGYDLGRRLESLPTIANDDIAFPAVAIGIYAWALLHDIQQQRWFMVHYQGEAALAQQLLQLEQTFAATGTTKTDFQLLSDWQAQLSRAQYQQKFARIQHYLHSGDCYQINLTQRFSANYQGDEWQAYCALRPANQAPFSAFMRLPQGCVLSLSPERFLAVNADGQIVTKPIKGTAARCTDAAQDQQQAQALQLSEKNRAENLMIVDLLRNDIGKVAAPGSVQVPALFAIESFPAVHHLVSTVTATLASGQDPLSLLAAAFPGGSITGAPKIRAMEIIEELEPSRRNLYCGSLLWLSQDGQMDSSIAIRTLLAVNGQLHCWAGGGIVADSEVDSEYQESWDKVSRILPCLSQFNAE